IHRSSVLAALGYKDFIARLNVVIQKANASYFPNVVNNLYSKEDAVKIFNQIYKGQYIMSDSKKHIVHEGYLTIPNRFQDSNKLILEYKNGIYNHPGDRKFETA